MKLVVPKKSIAIPSAWTGPQFTRKSILGASTKYTTMPATANGEEEEKQAYIYMTTTSENDVRKLRIPA